jgi:hypothetical protein
MRRIARLALGLLLVAALLWAGVCLAVPWLLDTEPYRKRAEEALTGSLGRRVTLAALRVSLWSGPQVILEGIQVSGGRGEESEARPSELDVERLAVRLRLLPLLAEQRAVPRRWRVEAATAQPGGRPVIRVAKGWGRMRRESDGTWAGTSELLGVAAPLPRSSPVRVHGRWRVEPGRLHLEAASVSAGRASPDLASGIEGVVTRASGPEGPLLEFDVRSSRLSLGGIASQLGWSGARARPGPSRAPVARLDATDFRVRGDLSDGMLRLEEAALELYGGRLRAAATLQLNEADPAYRATVEVDDVALDLLAEDLAPDRARAVEGIARFELDLEGRLGGERPARSVSGDARFDVREGRLTGFGLRRQISRLVEFAGGEPVDEGDARFERLGASFQVADGTGRTEDFRLRSTELDLDGEGTVGVDGLLGLSVVAAFSPDASARLVEQVPQLRFRIDREGRLTVPLRVRGSLGSPDVQLDLDRVLLEGFRAAPGERAGRNLFRRLLGRE